MSIWIRLNQAGYTPKRDKKAVVLSEKNIMGAAWTITKDGETVLSGVLGPPSMGDDVHMKQEFYYYLDFSCLEQIGEYVLDLPGSDSQKIIISADPYSHFAAQAIGHLRLMRSGCPTPLTKAGHMGDRSAIQYVIEGDPDLGKWVEVTPRRTIDMLGGHYDAGDCIKFTLTVANLVWHLLRAFEENPSLFTADLLDEIKYGLDYLVKTFPDENTFVIQVGDKFDHHQGRRLPENDPLDGKRPALCALSRTHMGKTAAALALGACLLKNDKYRTISEAIYARAKKPDTLPTAFERDTTNDFYYDTTDADNMALAAIELYFLTKNEEYLNDAKAYAPPPGTKVSWAEMHGHANHRMAQSGDQDAKDRLFKEISSYKDSNPWGIPGGKYAWGSLGHWVGMANLMQLHADLPNLKDKTEQTQEFLNVIDYIFGRNNWGLCMLATPDLPNSVKHMYNWIWQVLGKLAIGALSEGPANKTRHDGLNRYFDKPKDTSTEKFNTSAAVFYDNGEDFMIQESTIWGQGSFILMLSLLKGVTP